MKIKVMVNENDDTILTRHPLYEVKHAKAVCDEVKEKNLDNVTVHTVSTDAVGTYDDYGKKLGIDVELYLNGNISTLSEVFKSFNKSFDYLKDIMNDRYEQERNH